MKRTANKFFLLALPLVMMGILISGCSPAVTPEAVEPTLTLADAYPAVNQQPVDTLSAYPAETGGEDMSDPMSPENVVAPSEAPQPEQDKASASGTFYSISSGTVLWNFQFYFTPAQGENKDEVPPVLVGGFSDKGDIMLATSAKGDFQVNNIPPGNYYIVLIAPGDYLVAVNSPTDMTPRMFTFNANEAQPLGLIVFP